MALPALHEKKARRRKEGKGRLNDVVRAARPTNAEAERLRFFDGLRAPGGAAAPRYEPQFLYDLPQPALEDALRRHSDRLRVAVEGRYLPHALRVLKATLEQYGSYTSFLERTGGEVVPEAEARVIVDEYLAQHRAENEVTVNFNPSLVAQASYEKKSHNLNIRPQGMRRNFIQGTLHHEIGTHYLRDRNDRLQPWAREVNGRRKYRLEDKNPTEEGLATLHTVLEREGHSLWRAALLYYAVWRAVRLSFHELYDDLAQFLGDCEEERWDCCVRAKRGLLDTSQPGGFVKDQMYFIGAMEILEQRRRINFCALYLGKLSVLDAHRCKATGLARTTGLRLPIFLQGGERLARYHALLDEMVRDNGLSGLVDGAAEGGGGACSSAAPAAPPPEAKRATPRARSERR